MWHHGLKALDGGNWKTGTYGTKSFVTPSAFLCPSVPPPFRLNTGGSEVFRTQSVFSMSAAQEMVRHRLSKENRMRVVYISMVYSA